MVKLKQIEKNGDQITCIAFVEDCKEPIEIIFHIPDGSVQNSPLPAGYEWCRSHIYHAQSALEKMAKEGEFPENWNIMWY